MDPVKSAKRIWIIAGVVAIFSLGAASAFIVWRMGGGVLPGESEAAKVCEKKCTKYESRTECTEWGVRTFLNPHTGQSETKKSCLNYATKTVCISVVSVCTEVGSSSGGSGSNSSQPGGGSNPDKNKRRNPGNAGNQADGSTTQGDIGDWGQPGPATAYCPDGTVIGIRNNGTTANLCDPGVYQACSPGGGDTCNSLTTSGRTGPPPSGTTWSCWHNQCVFEEVTADTIYLNTETGLAESIGCTIAQCQAQCSGSESTHTMICETCGQYFTCTCPGTSTSDVPDIPDTPPRIGDAWCVSLDDSETGDGRHIFSAVQGEAFSTTLYTETATKSGGSVRGYSYTAQSGVFNPGSVITVSGSSATDEVDWALTAAQTSALSLGGNDGAFVTVVDNRGNVTGGDDTSCSVDLYITAEDIPPGVPYWVLTKTASTVCIDDDQTAIIDYVITLANLGDTTGTIAEVVDTLDSKITADMISEISPAGTFDPNTHTITWDNGGAGYTIAGGNELQFTYRVTMDDEDFGTYENAVNATPSDESTPPEEARAIVDVTCQLPSTAITDESLSTQFMLVMGITLFILAFAEINFGIFSRSFNYADKKLSKEENVKKQRDRFESKF